MFVPLPDVVRAPFADARQSPFPYVAFLVVVVSFLVGMRVVPWREGAVAHAVTGYTYGQWLLHTLLALTLFVAGALAVQRVPDASTGSPSPRLSTLGGAFLAWWAAGAVAVTAGVAVVWTASLASGHALAADALAWILGGLVLGVGTFTALGFGLGAVGRTGSEAVAAALTGWALAGPVFDQVYQYRLRFAFEASENLPRWAEAAAHVTPVTPLRRLIANAGSSAWMGGFVNELATPVMAVTIVYDSGFEPARDAAALLAWTLAGLLVAWAALRLRAGARRLDAGV